MQREGSKNSILLVRGRPPLCRMVASWKLARHGVRHGMPHGVQHGYLTETRSSWSTSWDASWSAAWLPHGNSLVMEYVMGCLMEWRNGRMYPIQAVQFPAKDTTTSPLIYLMNTRVPHGEATRLALFSL